MTDGGWIVKAALAPESAAPVLPALRVRLEAPWGSRGLHDMIASSPEEAESVCGATWRLWQLQRDYITHYHPFRAALPSATRRAALPSLSDRVLAPHPQMGTRQEDRLLGVERLFVDGQPLRAALWKAAGVTPPDIVKDMLQRALNRDGVADVHASRLADAAVQTTPLR